MANFRGASPADTPKPGRELVVILELEPVDQAVFRAAQVHFVEQVLAVEAREDVGPEQLTKTCVRASRILRPEELAINRKLSVKNTDLPAHFIADASREEFFIDFVG